MGLLDGTSVTVDACLTKKGREILKNGGSLNISTFTASDTGVDYTLWNTDHPSGSAYYGEGIENLRMLEASVHAKYSLRNRLVTLPPNTISVPSLSIQIPGSTNFTKTFEDDEAGSYSAVTAVLKGYAPGTAGTELYAIINSPQIVNITNATMVKELDGIAYDYVREADIQRAKVYKINKSNQGSNVDWTIQLSPDVNQKQTGRETNITLIEKLTGAYNEFKVVNNVTRLHRNLLAGIDTKGT